MVGTLRRSSSPTSHSKRVQLDQAAQGLTQQSFESLQGWRFPNLSRQSVQVVKYLPTHLIKISCVATALLLLILSLCTCQKSLTPSSLHPPVRLLKTAIISSPIFIWYRPKKTSSQPLLIHCVLQPPIIHWTCSSVSTSVLYWGVQNRTPYCETCWHKCQAKGKNLFTQPAGHTPAKKSSACSSSLLQGHAADSRSPCCPLQYQSPFLQSHLLPRVLPHGIAPPQMHNFIFAFAELCDVSASSFLWRHSEYHL